MWEVSDPRCTSSRPRVLNAVWMGQALSGTACSGGLGALGEFEWVPDAHLRFESNASPSSASVRYQSRRSNVEGNAAEGTLGDDLLSARRRPREKSRGCRDFLAGALRSSRMCALLDENDIESLTNALEYHVFGEGEVVARQGALGGHFFVPEAEGLEVWLNGGRVGSIARGQTFGETSLLQRCPRHFSVVAARPGVGVWAADGRLFRRAVQASVMLQVADNRAFLDSIVLFEGLAVRQLDDVADASTPQVVNIGECLSRAGEDSPFVYLVKSGKLRIVAGSAQDGRSEDVLLGPGSCICERVLLYDEPFSMTAEAVKRCEVLRVNVRRLRQTMGHDLSPIRLQQSFLKRVFQKSGLFSTWSAAQLALAAESMELVELAPDAKGSMPQNIFVVLDGTVKLGSGSAVQWLRRGHWHGTVPSPDLHEKAPSIAGDAPPALVAGQSGCRLAMLSADSSCGGSSPSRGEDPDRSHARMARTLAKVCVFRHLPQLQLDVLVSGLTRRRYKKGEKVVLQGDRGTHFYVVVEGEAFELIDGKVVRKIARFGYFGERAILFGEPRAATIEVASSAGAEIWALDRDTFRQVVRDKTLTAEQLKYRVWLQDPGLELKDLKRLGVIGCGTSGVVHLVRHKTSGFTYALKRVSKKDGRIPRQVRREIEVLAENDHPFIMHLVKTLELPDCVFLLTEFIAGGELHAAIRTISTVLSRSQAMFYTGSMLLMLEALNDRDIVYRDLKPENVMLDAQGYLKLIDFGSAKKLESSCLRTFTMVGTPHYMAPEVMRGKGYGTEVDIWALGVILYELVCGYLPFGDNCENTGDVCKAVLAGDLQFPSELEEIMRELIEGLLVPKPHLRLGCNAHGYEEIKGKPFFSLEGLVVDGLGADADHERRDSAHFFSLLVGRELQAPIPPSLQEPTKDSENDDGEDGWGDAGPAAD
mmetsp:Transcript_114831/g.364946  ORF Transcript_114831/g.364946 Transcript_114831/m.364946 type:complete len:931 (-) Transcript_114831:109-2901(-)